MSHAAITSPTTPFDFHPPRARPGLLVSVRSAPESLAAIDGGADIVDLKEPHRGPLGPADDAVIAGVVRAVGGRLPVTAAMGELSELAEVARPAIPAGISLFKIGLAGCRSRNDWQAEWRRAVGRLATPDARPVAVAYADWRSAGAPEPEEILTAAVAAGCPALLVDTWDKSAGALFDHLPADQLRRLILAARSRGLLAVLAGSLAGDALDEAVTLAPDFIAVRGAACDAGRRGTVSRHRVAMLKQAIQNGATRAN